MTEAELKVYTGLYISGAESDPVRVVVQGGDYVYTGWLVGMAEKRNRVRRAVVEDENKRLFIHNVEQLRVVQ